MDGILLNMTWNPATWDVPTILSCICSIASVTAIIVALVVGKESTENAKKIINSNYEDAQSQIKALDENTSKQLQKLTTLAEAMAEQTGEVTKLAKIMNVQNEAIKKQVNLLVDLVKQQYIMSSYKLSCDAEDNIKQILALPQQAEELKKEGKSLSEKINDCVNAGKPFPLEEYLNFQKKLNQCKLREKLF